LHMSIGLGYFAPVEFGDVRGDDSIDSMDVIVMVNVILNGA